MEPQTSQLLISTAVQLPIVAVFAWFVHYMLKYNAEQLKMITEAFTQSQKHIADRIEQQESKWREFVNQRDERYREVLKELEFAVRRWPPDTGGGGRNNHAD